MNRHHAPIPMCWKLFLTGVASFMGQCPICTVGGRLASIILASSQQFIIVQSFIYLNSKWKPMARSVRNNKWLLIDIFIFFYILPLFIHLYMWLFHMHICSKRIYNMDFCCFRRAKNTCWRVCNRGFLPRSRMQPLPAQTRLRRWVSAVLWQTRLARIHFLGGVLCSFPWWDCYSLLCSKHKQAHQSR